MKKARIIVSVLFAVLGIVLLLYFIFFSDREKRYQWYENYKAESKEPYGTFFIKTMLESYIPSGRFDFNKDKPLKVLLKGPSIKNTNYVFIGQSISLDVEDEDALLNFIQSGNDAFIATLELPAALMLRVYEYECNKEISMKDVVSDSIRLDFYHDTLKYEHGYIYRYRIGSEDVSYDWNSFNEEIFCDSTKSIVPLGYQKPGGVNFLKLPYGQGNLFLHSNPLVFTNYFLTQAEKSKYAAGVFSHLQGKNIVWDEYSKIPFFGNSNVYNSPLYYILQQPSLKYAWWLLLLSVLLYLFFVAKRTQRAIPVINPKMNTSLEYIHQISSLHHQNGNHLDMARKKMKYFLYFIRSKYGIQAQTFTTESRTKLAEKSRVNLPDIHLIFDQYNVIESNPYYNIGADQLVNFYYAIDNFYKNCK